MEHDRRFISVSIPEINELRCLIGRVKSDSEIRNSSRDSLYHFRIIQCRSLIDSSPEVIALPGIIGLRRTDRSKIYIVAKKEFLATGEIQRRLSNMGIEYSEPTKATSQLYKACLLYTMQQRLSPRWNLVEKYLLAGEDFLASISAPTKAMKLDDVVMDGKDAYVAVSPACVTVSAPLRLSSFSLSATVVREFLDNDNGFIKLVDFKTQTWVFVLPSLKKGRVVSISKKIPESCPFRNYQQLRSHWKDMYGYRMPETEVGLIYYQLNFPGLGTGAFTYPSCCVSSDKLHPLRIKNGDYVVSQFSDDLISTVRKLCGTQFKTEEKMNSVLKSQEDQKENIPNMAEWAAQNDSKILNHGVFGTPRNCMSANIYSGSDSGRKPLSAKGNSLQKVLSMKPFLQFQPANKKYLIPFSDEFISTVENKRVAGKSKLVSGSPTRVKTEASPGEYLQDDYELLRSRSSFELKDFCQEKIVQAKAAKTFCYSDEAEEKSKYFPDLGQTGVKNDPEERGSSSKLNLLCLSKRIESKRVADFKTKDICGYFRETKVKANVSQGKRSKTGSLVPTKLVQTRLNFLKRSKDLKSVLDEEIYQCAEAKKMKFVE